MEIIYSFIGGLINLFIIGAIASLAKSRMRRLHYSLFILFLLPMFIATSILISELNEDTWITISLIFTFDLFIAILSITISRLHDINSSGWLSLLLLIPIINILLIVALIFTNGTAGTNRFGENPKLKGTAPLNTQD